MNINTCPKCGTNLEKNLVSCPKCGYQIKKDIPSKHYYEWFSSFSFEWKTNAEIFGWPLIHIAIGRNKATGKLLVAKGIIAIGQFAIGLITIAQFGIGILFGLGQFMAGFISIAQFALGIYFGLGQFATGIIAVGQFAVGKYIFAQLGFGKFIWSSKIKNPIAIEYFKNLWNFIKSPI